MRYTIYILCILLFSSCLTKKQWERRYPPSTDTLIVEKEVIKEVVRDTTVYYPVPGDTVYDKVLIPIPCPELPEFDLSEFVLSKEVKFAKAEAWLTYSLEAGFQMHLLLEQKEQEIEMHFKGIIRERDYWHEKATTIDAVREVEVLVDNFWTRLYRWFFWIAIALVTGYLATKIKKPW